MLIDAQNPEFKSQLTVNINILPAYKTFSSSLNTLNANQQANFTPLPDSEVKQTKNHKSQGYTQ
jgi:hypothetical protein